MVSEIVQAIDALSLKDMLWPLLGLLVLIACLGYAIGYQHQNKNLDMPADKKPPKNNDDILTPSEVLEPRETFSATDTLTTNENSPRNGNQGTLKEQNEALEKELKEAHLQIDAQEKLASVGILSAGIAHEIKNPLNFINNFSETTVEIANELKEAISKALANGDPAVREDIIGLANEISDNCEKMKTHGKRAESIIRNMLIQARTSTVDKEPADVNALLDEFVNLAYHGMRAQDSNFNAKIEKILDPTIPKLVISPQSMGRVFLNLINNALYAINEKAQHLKKKDPTSTFMPTITVTTQQTADAVLIKIRDNGEGIALDIQPKIFERFFTTKPAGHGTGLGLPICYEIVVTEHGGNLSVSSTPPEFTEFTIQLPKKQ